MTTLHGFIVVAPLKPDALADAYAALADSPRLYRRGPIEALTTSLRACSCGISPRLYRRGPIEASPVAGRLRLATAPLHGFIVVAPLKLDPAATGSELARLSPRLYRRGPIEAPSLTSSITSSSSSLHGFIVVAPLKRRRCEAKHRGKPCSPRLYRRGPIEAWLARHFLVVCRASPRLYRRGPIEASSPPSRAG